MTYRVFICHSYGHRDIYFELVQKLNSIASFDWRNTSVQYDMRFGTDDAEVDNDDLRNEISKRIAECDVFLALTKPVATRRRWLQWEIKYAKSLGKPIVGVARRRNDRRSRFVDSLATDVVDTWRVDHLINAIKGYGNEYIARQRTAIIVPPALPPEETDTEVDAMPSPPVAEEPTAQEMIAALGNNIERTTETPRDVLFPDLGSVVPEKGDRDLVSERPRWWWPFAGGSGRPNTRL